MQEDRRKQLLSRLVQVDSALHMPAIASLIDEYGRGAVTEAVREAIESARRRILSGTEIELAEEVLRDMTLAILHRTFSPSLCRVINATGIIIHTGLGRAVMPRECLDALSEIASGYCLLEMGRESGRRSHRMEHVEKLLKDISGAEAAHVVNNDAAAVMLALRTLAYGRDAICSRAEQVEIVLEKRAIRRVDAIHTLRGSSRCRTGCWTWKEHAPGRRLSLADFSDCRQGFLGYQWNSVRRLKRVSRPAMGVTWPVFQSRLRRINSLTRGVAE